MLRAFRYRNFRLFFIGQIVSVTGMWMSITATSWLVYRLTDSPKALGLVNFSGQIPAFILIPWAGVFVDRWNRHRLLIVTQSLAMLQSFALAALTLSGLITIPMIVALSALGGLINAFDMPGRQSFIVSIVEKKEDLSNAIGLNSSMFNVARLLGPSMAGLIIARSNEGWCFFIDGASYLAILVALLCMNVKVSPTKSGKLTSAFKELKEGWQYTFGFVPIRSIIILLALISLLGVPYGVLIPVFAGKILQGGPHTLGFLMGASGCGALIGALWLSLRRSVLGLGRLIPLSTSLFGFGLIGFACSRRLDISMVMLFLAGFGFMVEMAASNTILQTIVEDHMRGRVMSFFIMAFLGAAPFGSLLAGMLASRYGTPQTILMCGLCCIGGAIWFAWHLPALRREIRPIYVKLGIVQEIAEGLQTTVQLTAMPKD